MPFRSSKPSQVRSLDKLFLFSFTCLFKPIILNVFETQSARALHKGYQTKWKLGSIEIFRILDIVIDDRNEVPYFTPEQMKRKCEKEEYISNSNTHHFNESKYEKFDTAKTVYIGAGKSALPYRFYDKDKTQNAIPD